MKFLHTEVLDSLRERVRERQEKHRARMAKGLPVDEYRELVGRHKECDDLIEVIREIAEDSGVSDDDDGKTTRS